MPKVDEEGTPASDEPEKSSAEGGGGEQAPANTPGDPGEQAGGGQAGG